MSNIKNHIDEFLNWQKSRGSNNPMNSKNLSKSEFDKHQAEFFDQQADWYISENATPADIKMKLNKMLTTIKDFCVHPHDEPFHVLDVGSGAGVLIPLIQNNFSNASIHAIDLSKKQLNNLHQRYPDVVIHQGDISSFSSKEKFDLIFCNACFGNFYSQTEALATMSKLLRSNGIIAITHPLGAKFVAQWLCFLA